ncbi:MAG: aldo/keto reductase [Candidatus Omnitrophica bacterium]|nr:aldo/keto reductase [Candidatus Omnitrophota bacterium]
MIKGINTAIAKAALGTWAFGGDSWWGKQDDKASMEVLSAAIGCGINLIDTAPMYGRGRSERTIGAFLRKNKLREKVVLATKLGLSWQGSRVFHDLSRKRMLAEIDESRKRLDTDYFDLYQVHWPDPDAKVQETAEIMYGFYKKGLTKAVGVSNYSLEQMKEFMEYCPLHSLQSQYSMFVRDIEEEIVPFCQKNDIAILTYAPLYSGILTGKFFLDNVAVPDDINRKMKRKDFQEPRFSINKETLQLLKNIASEYHKTLTQLVINWNFSQPGVFASIVGARSALQLKENSASMGWDISQEDSLLIENILKSRFSKLAAAEES